MRGRKPKSLIRDRMQQIVDALGVTYGYEIFKVYESAFAPIDIRSMYYHLARGVGLGEFEFVSAKEERGGFTWGGTSIRKYYILGHSATKGATEELHSIIKGLKLSHRQPKNYIDWQQILKEKTVFFEGELNKFLKNKKVDGYMILRLDDELSNMVSWFEKNKIKCDGLWVLEKKIKELILKLETRAP